MSPRRLNFVLKKKFWITANVQIWKKEWGNFISPLQDPVPCCKSQILHGLLDQEGALAIMTGPSRCTGGRREAREVWVTLKFSLYELAQACRCWTGAPVWLCQGFWSPATSFLLFPASDICPFHTLRSKPNVVWVEGAVCLPIGLVGVGEWPASRWLGHASGAGCLALRYRVPPLFIQSGLNFAFSIRFIQTVGPPCLWPHTSRNQNPPGCSGPHSQVTISCPWFTDGQHLPLNLTVTTSLCTSLSLHEAIGRVVHLPTVT